MRLLTARPTEARSVAELVFDAFKTLPQADWLVPDPVQRFTAMHGHFLLTIEHAIQHDQVDVTAEGTAAAVWLYHDDSTTATDPADYMQRLAQCTGPHLKRFRELDAAFAAHHPNDRPHHCLALLAVRPEHQRRGLGTTLLRRHHRTLDKLGLPAYLDASCPESRDLYLREGYAVHAEYDLPDGGPRMYAMCREPRAPGPTV